MTDKKISRRGFIKGLAVCSVAIPFAPDIIAASPPPVVVTEVSKADKMYPPLRTVRTGLPKVGWRNLKPDKATEEIVAMLSETNEILDDFPMISHGSQYD